MLLKAQTFVIVRSSSAIVLTQFAQNVPILPSKKLIYTHRMNNLILILNWIADQISFIPGNQNKYKTESTMIASLWDALILCSVCMTNIVVIHNGYWFSNGGTILLWLTHWGQVRHLCVGKLTIIVSDNGLSPGWRQAITWTNDGILLIRTLETNFIEILIRIHTFSVKKMDLKMLSGKWQPSWPQCVNGRAVLCAPVSNSAFISQQMLLAR